MYGTTGNGMGEEGRLVEELVFSSRPGRSAYSSPSSSVGGRVGGTTEDETTTSVEVAVGFRASARASAFLRERVMMGMMTFGNRDL